MSKHINPKFDPMFRQIPHLLRSALRGLWQHRQNNWPVLWTLFFAALIQMAVVLGAWSLDQPLRSDPKLWEVRVLSPNSMPSKEADSLLQSWMQGIQSKWPKWKFEILDTNAARLEFEALWGKDWTQSLDSNPFPPSLKISWNTPSPHATDLQQLISATQTWQNQGAEVYHALELVTELEARRTQMIWIAGGTTSIVLFLLWGILGNSVRGLLLSRREALRTLDLLGAHKLYIAFPILTEMTFLALGAIGMALISLYLACFWILDWLWTPYQWLSLIAIASTAPIIGIFVTWRSIQRFLQESETEWF
jgi:cell division protein FtsX